MRRLNVWWRIAIVAGGVILASDASAGELRITDQFPAAGADGICPDTPLHLDFATAPSIGPAGLILVTDTTTGVVVDTIDVGAGPGHQTIGGIDGFRYHPVSVDGKRATIHVRNGALQRGHGYAVTIDPGVFIAGDDSSGGFASSAPWRFRTRVDAPPADAARLIVAADGSGDFCTVQGAFDFVPEENRRPVTVFVKRGVYTEILCLFRKHAVTLLGEDRKETIIGYANNANFNGSGGNPYAGAGNPSAANPRAGDSVYRRGAFLVHQCDDFSLENLTLRNSTPQGGSQAEAIILNGSLSARAVIRDVDFYSYQDTVQINGQAYVTGCRVEGDVDFLWGKGPCFFEHCTFRTLRSGAYFTQVRNPGTNHGFVFLRCTFDGALGVTGNYLTRVEPTRFPESEVVLMECVLGEAVAPVGWQLQRDRGAAVDPAPANVRFLEYDSRTPSRAPVDVSQRHAASRQLLQPQDAELIAHYSDPAWVLGGGWNPRSAPAEHEKE